MAARVPLAPVALPHEPGAHGAHASARRPWPVAGVAFIGVTAGRQAHVNYCVQLLRADGFPSRGAASSACRPGVVHSPARLSDTRPARGRLWGLGHTAAGVSRRACLRGLAFLPALRLRLSPSPRLHSRSLGNGPRCCPAVSCPGRTVAVTAGPVSRFRVSSRTSVRSSLRCW